MLTLRNFEYTVKHSMSLDPTSRSLPINIHWYCCQRDSNRCASNDIEGMFDTLRCNPVVCVESKSKCEKVLDQVHNSESFGRLLTMTVRHIGYYSSSTKLDTKIYDPQADDDRDWPRLAVRKALAVAKKATATKCSQKNEDWKTEFRLCDK